MALTAIHPGEHLAEELEALKMSAAALARQLKVPTNRITEIINAQSRVAGDSALPTSLAPARSSGSIFRASTSCA
jgi:antitoxin HigA-1